jgi:hypothetical protein
MAETNTARPLINSAEQAASAGDYDGAERLLREAVEIQEAELGRLDPELANTLNNLGVVCEILDKPADAEQFYQRAHEIAAAALAPDHPFVTTSRKNLEDFHRARGHPPAPPRADPVMVVEEPARAVDPPDTAESARSAQSPQAGAAVQTPALATPLLLPETRPAMRRRNNPRLIVLAALGVVLAIGMVTVSMLWGGFNRREEPAMTQPAASRPESAAPPAAESDRLAKEAASAGEKEVAGAGTPAPATPPEPRSIAPARPPSKSARPTVTSARLCRVLSTSTSSGDWQCTPPRRPVEAGLLSFYTRVRSTTNTTVQHRWYRGDRLYQSRDLRIGANAESGYRTFSRYRMSAESRGRWRVELRSADGMLLHEEQFEVR